MDERERIRREMEAADAIRATSDERIASPGDAICSDLYDKLIPRLVRADAGPVRRRSQPYADRAQDAALPAAEAPQAEPPAQEEVGLEALCPLRCA